MPAIIASIITREHTKNGQKCVYVTKNRQESICDQIVTAKNDYLRRMKQEKITNFMNEQSHRKNIKRSCSPMSKIINLLVKQIGH